jgi:Tfp pilus assembly protein PilP
MTTSSQRVEFRTSLDEESILGSSSSSVDLVKNMVAIPILAPGVIILACNQALDADLEEFIYQVNLFALQYFRPVSPYKDTTYTLLLPQSPLTLPHPSLLTNPLGTQK